MGYLTRNAPSSTALFEIRLDGLERDVVVVKGPPGEAASVLLAGRIVLAINEPLHIKRLSLRLLGDLRLNWIEHLESATATYSKPTRYLRRVYEHTWDNLHLQTAAAGTPRTNKSTTSLRSLASPSSSSLRSLGASPAGASSSALNRLASDQSHVLAPGNHEFPFLVILPGDIAESVEGLPGGSVFYKLEAVIERGKFAKKKVASRHLRVVRTLTPDAPELLETMSIDNCWPQKVEYTISIPSRAVAIGAPCPVNFLMAPLLKGLALGSISIKLVEHYSFTGNAHSKYGHTNERTIAEAFIPEPDSESYGFNERRPLADENGLANNFVQLSHDRWEVEKSLQIPPSLSRCTQDVTIGKNLKVRHKLSVVVALKNPNGHTSELRAVLPVILYISPFVPVSAKYSEHALICSFSDNIPSLSAEHYVNGNSTNRPKKKGAAPSPSYRKKSSANSASSSSTDLQNLNNNSSFELASPSRSPSTDNLMNLNENSDDEPDTEVLFSGADRAAMVDSSLGRPDLVAPPNYGEHIYDQLWSGIETPASTGTLTPMNIGSGGNSSGTRSPVGVRTPGGSGQGMSQRNFNLQLTKHLNELHLQRLAEEENDESIDNITSNSNTTNAVNNNNNNSNSNNNNSTANGNAQDQSDYFSLPRSPHRNSIVTPSSPDFSHVSRSNSSSNFHAMHSPPETPTANWDHNTLSRVPSYETATKSSSNQGIPAPVYIGSSTGNSSSASLSSANSKRSKSSAALSGQNAGNHPGFARALSSSSFSNLMSLGSSSSSSASANEGANSTSSSVARPATKRSPSFLHLRFGGSASGSSSASGSASGAALSDRLHNYALGGKAPVSFSLGGNSERPSDRAGKNIVREGNTGELELGVKRNNKKK